MKDHMPQPQQKMEVQRQLHQPPSPDRIVWSMVIALVATCATGVIVGVMYYL